MSEETMEQLSQQLTQLNASIELVSSKVSTSFLLSVVALVLVVGFILWSLFFSQKAQQVADGGKNNIREYLAIGIVVIGIFIVGLLAMVGVFVGGENFRREAMAGVLPLIGAWVGAVIAYYFGKENFQAASDSTAKLLSRDERLAATPVADIMLALDQVKDIHKFNDINAFKAQTVKAFADGMVKNRALILEQESSAPLLIVHKSTLHEYLAADGKRQTDTFASFYTNASDLWNKFTAFGVVGPEANAAAVKMVMHNVGPDCSDVYVTKGGTKSSEVVGLVTNVDLLKAEHL